MSTDESFSGKLVKRENYKSEITSRKETLPASRFIKDAWWTVREHTAKGFFGFVLHLEVDASQWSAIDPDKRTQMHNALFERFHKYHKPLVGKYYAGGGSSGGDVIKVDGRDVLTYSVDVNANKDKNLLDLLHNPAELQSMLAQLNNKAEGLIGASGSRQLGLKSEG